MISVKVPNLQSTTREHQIKPEMPQLNFSSVFQLDVGELDDQEILLNGSMVIKKEPDPQVNDEDATWTLPLFYGHSFGRQLAMHLRYVS